MICQMHLMVNIYVCMAQSTELKWLWWPMQMLAKPQRFRSTCRADFFLSPLQG